MLSVYTGPTLHRSGRAIAEALRYGPRIIRKCVTRIVSEVTIINLVIEFIRCLITPRTHLIFFHGFIISNMTNNLVILKISRGMRVAQFFEQSVHIIILFSIIARLWIIFTKFIVIIQICRVVCQIGEG
ncbi:hypothetical protein D3C76_133630 [compost metagenome]